MCAKPNRRQHEEVRLLREEIDPLGVRKLETLSGAQRKELIREILKREA